MQLYKFEHRIEKRRLETTEKVEKTSCGQFGILFIHFHVCFYRNNKMTSNIRLSPLHTMHLQNFLSKILYRQAFLCFFSLTILISYYYIGLIFFTASCSQSMSVQKALGSVVILAQNTEMCDVIVAIARPAIQKALRPIVNTSKEY